MRTCVRNAYVCIRVYAKLVCVYVCTHRLCVCIRVYAKLMCAYVCMQGLCVRTCVCMGLCVCTCVPVAALSTIHDASMTTISRRSRAAEGGVERVRKPTMIAEYNTYMGGVDIADQLVTYYGFSHCCRKWWKRVFFHLLEVCMVNAYIMYCSSKTTRS